MKNPDDQKCNAAGVALIKKYEQCRLASYIDSGGVPTIGWGHTGGNIVPGLIWTQAQADQVLLNDILVEGEEPVNDLINYELTSNQFSALCSLCFNIGQGNFARSSALSCLNAGDTDDVGAHMALWDKDHAGNVLAGLTARRNDEIALFETPDTESTSDLTV